jgi:hypothetical protein
MARELHNLDDKATKARLMQRVGALSGLQWVDIAKFRRIRSNQQNRLYWGVYVAAFHEYMRDQGNYHWSAEMCHEALALMFLREVSVNQKTGEEIATTRSTASLTTSEFSDYLDKVETFLRDDCEILIPDRGVFVETSAAPKGVGAD